MLTVNRRAGNGQQGPAISPVAEHWDPLSQHGRQRAGIPRARPSMDVTRRMATISRYIGYVWLALIGLMFLPHLIFALASGSGGIGFVLPGMLMALVLGALYAFGARSRIDFVSKALEKLRTPAIHAPVTETATGLGLTRLGVMSSERLAALAAPLGDVHAALGLSGADTVRKVDDAPDEFAGRMPDAAPLWCLLKKNDLPLAGIPEQYRGGRPANGKDRATAFTMLAAFPLARQTGFRLEILHRIMQVRFVRVARTVDTGSAEFNNRFLVTMPGQPDALAVHRAVTPALQTALIELFDRFWLVNVVVDDGTVFVSAVDFRIQDDNPVPAARWMETALAELLAATARIRTYID